MSAVAIAWEVMYRMPPSSPAISIPGSTTDSSRPPTRPLISNKDTWAGLPPEPNEPVHSR
jgi:hypothetical protein